MATKRTLRAVSKDETPPPPPAPKTLLEAVQSGDPIAYTLLRAYPGLSADRDAEAINRSLALLAEVGASKQHAADAVASATAEIESAQARKAHADQQLIAIERDSLPD